MKIAVIGAGFCGLACAWHLANGLKAQVTLYDKQHIGAGASGLTAGLLHPYAGPKASLSFQAHEAMQETMKLLEVAGSPYSNGILRPQIPGMDFSSAKNYSDVEWWEPDVCRQHVPELLALPGLFIRSGITVNCPAYLKGLWEACRRLGVSFEQANITTPSDLSGFDYIIFTVGAHLHTLRDVAHPPVSLIKGQTLELEWQKETPLPFAINAGVQFSQISPDAVWAGATYERRFATEAPTDDAATEIRAKIAQFAPTFSHLPLKRIWTQVRAATNDKRPFITHTPPNVYTIGGMGSKGLLYHAWMAKRLCFELMH